MDLLNSIFIFSASIFYLLNIKKILEDKVVKGYNFWSLVFFCAWNVETAIFYMVATDFLYTQITYSACALINLWYLILVIRFKQHE